MASSDSSFIPSGASLSGKKAYFLSDLHLGAPYFPDSRESERRVVAFLESIRHDAAEIFLVGDILDYWYEYRYVVPRGFVRFFGKLAELTDSGIKVTWLIGNHDIWIFDYIPSELGVEVVDGVLTRSILGTTFLLAHGDGIPPIPRTFALIRTLFRNKFCQRLFAGIHPRWTVPFAYAWSHHSRKNGASPCANGRPLQNLIDFSTDYSLTHPDVRYFIFGHLHTLQRMKVGMDAELIVLGEWIKECTYGVFDGKVFSLHKFRARSLKFRGRRGDDF